MADSDSFDRRKFIKACVGAGAAVAADPSLMAQPAGELVPYVTTPCFLIDLGAPAEAGAELETSDGRPYRWSGGVGPGRSIVAFSAICAHRMSYPTRNVSFIDYRHKPMNTEAAGDDWWSRGQVIYCCSEGSVYDPSDGARVLAGPAPPRVRRRRSGPVCDRCLRRRHARAVP
jgi:Rieske Fe-S protein